MPGTQSIAQKETTSQKVNASNLRFRRDSGYGHKTYGSLEVISWYSQSLQQKKGSQTQNKHRIAKLTYNNLSLHNQALSQPLEANFQSNAAHTGPPMAMRESRTERSKRTDGGNQLSNPKLQSTDSTKMGPKRKCRSNTALLRRRVNRARNRNMHRRSYRHLKTQALALARQVPLFKAQDPTDNLEFLDWFKPKPFDSHTHTITHEEFSLGFSDYQDNSFKDHGITDYKIASLNCRGLASPSSRERLVHTMKKYHLDILCLQETKINVNSMELHDGFSFYWSSGIKDEDRNKAIDLKRSGKGSRDNPEHGQTFRNAIEHLGVGVVLHPRIRKYVLDVRQHSARNIMVSLKTRCGVLDILSTYAPQACHRDSQAAEAHYAELESLVSINYAFAPKLVLGDFNARLIKALPHETCVGPYTFGIERQDLDFLSDAQLENRFKFVEFCLENQFVVKNTFFCKPEAELVTYRSVGVKDWSPPWHPHQYSQMDYILVNEPWKNGITDIFATEVHDIDTDHKMLIANVRLKLKKKGRVKTTSRIKFHKPSGDEIANYNACVAQKADDLQSCDNTDSFDLLNSILLESSQATLPRCHPEQKKDYISKDTWDLLEKRWEAISNQDSALAETLSKDITKRVRLDKEQHLLNELEAIDQDGYKWDGLKKMRAKFTPNFTKFKDSAGNHVPYSDYPQKAADYLATTQWKCPSAEDPVAPSRIDSPLQDGRYIVSDDPFTIDELDAVLKKVKNNKTPGVDGVPGELFKWLDQNNRKLFLKVANTCLRHEEVKQHHMNAVVVSIYKKGDASSLANYRPISLLNSCYKIMAALVKERLDSGLDARICSTQYGFRKHRSTAQAIFLARRLQDIAEKSNARCTLVLLDWEKAFDRVSQDKLIETLYRLKVPEKLCNLIGSLYNDPQFKVCVGEAESTWRSQCSGIRQGCPLSPYLFTLVMGALFADVMEEIYTPRQLEPLDGVYFSKILYADDTLIFGANTQCINTFLHAIERHSKYFGVNLNYDKCVNLTANQRQSSVRFAQEGPAEGAFVPRRKSAVYLGTLLTDSFDNRAEILNRIGDCIATCRRLKLFWDKANTSIKWKIQVFTAIIRSKLLYGLECIQLTQNEISKLNAFQNKTLRRILKKPPTFIDREQTNLKMYDEIRQEHGCHFEPFGDTWRKKKLKLLGHMLRSSRADPLNQVTFAADGLRPRSIDKRRPGRPRLDWLTETYKDAFQHMYGHDQFFDPSDLEHMNRVKQWATQRIGPF